MCARVALEGASVLEIGCGDGFLTSTILQHPVKGLQVIEIDPEWVAFVQKTYPDPRLCVLEQDFLQFSLKTLKGQAPLTVLANIPYNITFPILERLRANASLLAEGVVMVQEEVAQKLVATSGRSFGFYSIYFRHVFECELLVKIPPTAFFPPPKVHSRLVYFKPRATRPVVVNEEKFWVFIKACFGQPRRMLKHNLLAGGYDMTKIPEATLLLRAQQIPAAQLYELWDLVRMPA